MFIKRCTSAALMLALTACGAPPSPTTAEPPQAPGAGDVATHPLALKTLGPVTLTPVVGGTTGTVGTAANSSPDLAVDGVLTTRWRVATTRDNARFTAQMSVNDPVPLVNLSLNSSALGVGDNAAYTVWVSTDGAAYTRIGGRRTKASGTASINLPAGTMAKFVQIRILDLPSRHTFGIAELAATVDFPAPPAPPGTEPGNVTGLYQFAQLFPGFPQYRLGDRLRYEAVGASTDLAQIALNNLAAEALALPSQVRLSGTATVTRTLPDGTTAPIATINVADMVQPLDELGVVFGTDPANDHEIELIWPEATEGTPGNAIVRVQLSNPPADLEGVPVNVSFELQKTGPNGSATWRGATTGTIVGAPEGGNPVPAPIPGGVVGEFAFQTLFGAVPQYRPSRGRLRFEAVGLPADPATVALGNLAGEALAAQPAFTFRARARIVRTSNGALLGRANVTDMVQPPDELGVIFGTDPVTGHEVEIIWPVVTDGIPGDPIIRIQLQTAPARLDLTAINADFTIEKVQRTVFGEEVVASWRGVCNNVTVPVARD